MKENKNYLTRGILWVALYTFLVITPLLMLILGPKSTGRVPLQNLSVSLAFAGLAVMGLQFALTARIKPLNEPFGTDMVYYYHRQIGIAAFLMIFAHPILLYIYYPGYVNYLNIFTAPLPGKAGVIALLLLIGVVWMAEFRSQLKIPYGFWKIVHGLVAIFTIAAAILHIYWNGNFINLPWKQQLWMTYFAVWMLLLLYTRILYPILLMRKPYEVVKVKPELGNCTTIQVKPPAGVRLSFHPGQFAWLTAWKTPFSDTEHPFSIASSAEKPELLEFTIKELGKFTARIKQLKPGQKVYVDGAYGSFSCDRYPQAKALVLLAGGIGITPMMSMLRSLADRGDKRPLVLFYANRDRESITLYDELDSLKKRLKLKVVHVLENPLKEWEGETGFITAEILQRHLDQSLRALEPQFFICGPKPMMDAVEGHLANIGYRFPQVHSERFAL